MTVAFTPPFVQPEHAAAHLRERGHVVLSPGGLAAAVGAEGDPLAGMRPFWDDLPEDEHLLDVGRYRFRRHGSFVVERGEVRAVPHRAHWQPLEYNALHGGIERWFAPLSDALVALPAWNRLLVGLTELADAIEPGDAPWSVEAHAFRITTAGGIGRPTPEGAHRDGVDLVAVLLVDREGVLGGETRVFDAAGPNGQRFTMTEPGTALVVDDRRAIHETTPIRQLAPDVEGRRDTLVVTWRRGGFQEP
ncbi:MAG: 2OG-Fe dioxygenase family protein [Planctomycetota bacterium]